MKIRKTRLARMSAITMAVVIAAAMALAGATAASAGVFTAHVISGHGVSYVNVRQSATTSSTVLRTIGAGAAVGLNCGVVGQSITGPYGASSIWYSIDGSGFVSDAYLETGSNKMVTSQCGYVQPSSQPVVNGRAWGATRVNNAGAPGQCTDGAYQKFKAYSGVYPALTGDAYQWYNSAKATGWTTSLDAQPNSIVVFQPNVAGASPTSGHVGWVDQTQQRSDGLYVHVIEMNYGKNGSGIWHDRWVKDVPGMSYILAPKH